MGRMKQIAEIIQQDEVSTLETMITLAKRHERETVFFRGETYTMEQAKNMLNFIYDELNKIRGTEQSIEQYPDSDDR